jgi:hypothetical protein
MSNAEMVSTLKGLVEAYQADTVAMSELETQLAALRSRRSSTVIAMAAAAGTQKKIRVGGEQLTIVVRKEKGGAGEVGFLRGKSTEESAVLDLDA